MGGCYFPFRSVEDIQVLRIVIDSMLILKNQQEEDLKIIKTSWGNEFESIMDFLVMKTKI